MLLDGGHVAEAVAHLRRAADMAPRSPAVRLLLADTLRRAGDVIGMEREYRTAMHLARGGALAAIAREHLKPPGKGRLRRQPPKTREGDRSCID